MKYAYSVSIFTFILVVNALFSVQPAFAATPITIFGNISSDTTWQTGEIYVVEGELTVNPGIRLTVQPGVIVKFEQWASLTVDGELVVNGTSVGEVYFTSFNDDSVGGDTNGDGPSTSSPGYWAQLRFNSGSDSSINYATIRFGGNGYNVDGNIGVAGGTVNISNSTIASSSNHGISKVGGSATIQHNIIKDNIVGIYVSGHGSITFNNNKFIDNSDVAGQFQYANWNTITSSGNTSSGIGKNAFFVYGAMLVDYTWTSELPYIVSATEVAPGVTLTVNQGAIIKFTDWSYIVVNGTLNANGTASLPIYFTSLKDDSVGGDTNKTGGTPASNDWGQIQFNQGSVGSMDHSVVRYGGSSWNVNSNIFVNGGTLAISNSVIASSSYFGLLKYGGSASITNSIIKDNGYGIVNASTVVIDARNNYWGDPSGPTYPLNPNGTGDSVSDNIDFIPFLTSPPTFDSPPTTKEPVIIVPGILGTEIKKGDETLWAAILRMMNPLNDDSFMDPMQFDTDLNPSVSDVTNGEVIRNPDLLYNYTDGLINLFTSSQIGYTENQDLFTFSYDWRFGVDTPYTMGNEMTPKSNAERLKDEIEHIITQTPSGQQWGRVNLIAHSTGGLLVKKYVIDNPSHHHIDKSLFVGVPNLGAPKAYKVLINGDNFGVPGLNLEEMKKISQNMPVAYDLAPTREYYNQNGSFFGINDPFQIQSTRMFRNATYDEATQEFNDNHLINSQGLNNSEHLHTGSFDNFDLRTVGVDMYNIVGCKSATFGNFIETINRDGTRVFDFPKTITGDGTVPLVSAQNTSANNDHIFFAIKSEHGKMLSVDGIRQQIVNIITGSNLSTGPSILNHDYIQAHPERCSLNGKVIKIKSPVTIDVVDQDGNHSGLVEDGSIENSIPGADYEVWGEHKYVFLPTDDGEQYIINLQGTGRGTFTVQDETIVDGQTLQTQVFANLSVSADLKGQINLGTNQTTLSLDTDGDGNIDEVVQPNNTISAIDSNDVVSPIVEILSPTSVSYVRSQVVPINVNLSDTESGVDFSINKFDGSILAGTPIDLFFYGLGNHSFETVAYDRAGNLGSKIVQFQVVATVESTISDIDRAYASGWIRKEPVKNNLVRKINKPISPNLLNELDREYNKGSINQQAYDIIKEDIVWLLNH